MNLRSLALCAILGIGGLFATSSTANAQNIQFQVGGGRGFQFYVGPSYGPYNPYYRPYNPYNYYRPNPYNYYRPNPYYRQHPPYPHYDYHRYPTPHYHYHNPRGW